MTTKPKAQKFRIRRPVQGATPALDQAAAETPTPQGTTPLKAVEGPLDAIRQEGLTGRQLRMARRVAQKHGLAPTSDFDAIRLLREKGIDPFQRADTLDLVMPESNTNAGAAASNVAQSGNTARDEEAVRQALGRIQLPQTTQNGKAQLPSTEVASPDDRALEIRRIQQDIAKRRRRKLLLLISRLSAFVFLPTLIAGYYFYVLATPMYATKSEFLIQQAEPPGASGAASLFGGSPIATSQDSIAVQGYLQSPEAMLRLDEDLGFKEHFSQENIDTLKRLAPDTTNSAAYKLYKKKVKIGYDPTEGIVRMEVIAADPETSALFAERLVAYAEERVDNISLRVREDAMKGARESYEAAEAERVEALSRVTRLQESLGVLNPAAANALLQSEMQQLQSLLLEKELTLASLLDNRRPNQARVDGTRAEIRRLEEKIADVQAQMTSTGGDANNQARKNAELRAAEEDYQTRTALLQQSLQSLETARVEAERQVRYLSIAVAPVPPDEASYPRKFENTILAFLIFAGIYLMISLTASILREQVTS
ncbi:capsule biosynthesis protein [Nereida sp. NH-UV-3]|uniref:capsule biosynthesis protein n=1 Tax=Nereida TaxID=282198 RepID=UPI0036F23A89